MQYNIHHKKGEIGVTLVELVIVLGILLLLVSGIRPLVGVNVSSQVNESASQIIGAFRMARERASARVNNSAHGVYLSINANGVDSMTLYQGSSYALRDSNYDLTTTFDAGINVVTTLSGTEANFARQIATPSTTGTITVTHASGGISKIITLGATGKIESN